MTIPREKKGRKRGREEEERKGWGRGAKKESRVTI